jgi:hypothetical protein
MRDPLVSSNDSRPRNSHDGSACQRAQKCQWNKWHRTVQWRSGSRPSKGDIHIIATLTTVRDLLFGDVVYCNRYTEILGHVLGRGTKTATNIQNFHARLELELATNQVVLVVLRFFQGFCFRYHKPHVLLFGEKRKENQIQAMSQKDNNDNIRCSSS